MAVIFAAFQVVSAQSYFDDDIYYDASKDKAAKAAAKKSGTSTSNSNYYKAATYGNNSARVVVADYPAADSYSVNGTRTISVDEYNRRGIFATDSLSADTTATDFQYTRRIEQYYNPEIVSGSGDEELAQIYYMEPQTVNVYVNTPTAYWGYDYFYPSIAWSSPYYYNNFWRWNSPWYWNTWYDPYWAWGPSWGWGPSMGRPYNPRHPGVHGYRPGNNTAGSRPNGSYRPGLTNGGRHQGTAGYRPGNNQRPNYNYNGTATGRPGIGTNNTNGNRHNGYTRPNNTNSNSNRYNGYTRPNNTNNNSNYSRPQNTNGGRFGGGSYSGGNRGGGFSGGGRSSAGGRGRH